MYEHQHVILPNSTESPEKERLAVRFAECGWAYALPSQWGEVKEFAFLPWLIEPPMYPPILFDDCSAAVWLAPRKIARAFALSDHQASAWTYIYGLVFPHWDEIEKISGYPSCNYKTNTFIMRKFIEFDQRYHGGRGFDIGVQAGGLWMGMGFSTLNSKLNLPDWVVLQVSPDNITYKPRTSPDEVKGYVDPSAYLNAHKE